MINLGSNSARVDKNLLQVSSLATSNSCDIADHQHQHQHRHHQHHQGHHRSSDGDEHSPDDAARAAAASAAQAQASAAATAFNRAWLAKTAKQNLSESCVLKAATCNVCVASSHPKIHSSCNINWAPRNPDTGSQGGQDRHQPCCNDDDEDQPPPPYQQHYHRQYVASRGGSSAGGGSSASQRTSSASASHYPDLNNTALNHHNNSNSNLRTNNTYKLTDNNYSIYNNNQFGECNHLLGPCRSGGAGGGPSAAGSSGLSGGSVAGSARGLVQKNNFFKNFARSSSFLNGCKIRPNSKKLRNISLKLKKPDRPQSACVQHHQLSCQNLHTHNSASTVSQLLLQNNDNANTGSPVGSKDHQQHPSSYHHLKRASLKTLNDSIKNVYRANSDLKNQYNAKTNSNADGTNLPPQSLSTPGSNYSHNSGNGNGQHQQQQHVLLNDFSKSPYSNTSNNGSSSGHRNEHSAFVRSKCFDRQLSVPIEPSISAGNNLGIHATNKHCHSYSNSLNRSKKTSGKPNGR